MATRRTTPFLIVLAMTSAASKAAAAGIATRDGLTLSLAPAAVTVAGRRLPAGALPGGLLVRDADRRPRPNLVRDPGIEGGVDGWELGAGSALSPDVAHAGRYSLRLEGPERLGGQTTATASLPVAASGDTEYVVGLWLRGEDAVHFDRAGHPLPNWSVRVRQTDDAGAETAPPQELGFPAVPAATFPWTRLQTALRTQGATRRLHLLCRAESGHGQVWLDDVELAEVGSGPEVDVTGQVTATPTGARQEAELAELGLALEARYTGGDSAIAVAIGVRDTTGRDRAVQVGFRLPADLRGWHWGEDVLTARPVQPGAELRNWFELGPGRYCNSYPFAAVGDDRTGLAVGVPPESPRIARTLCTADGLTVWFDLGLSPATERFPGRADVALVVFAFPAAGGFRAAVRRYWDLHPDCFARRSAHVGMWGLYVDPAKLRNAEDFGLRFGGAPLNWADQHGVCSLIYTEPWGWWLPWTAVGTPGERRPPPSTAEATARLLEATRADAGEDGGFMLPYVPKAEIARAVLNSCPEDAAGQPDPCSGLGWSALGSSTWLLHCLANPDPEILPLPNRASVTRERIVAPYFRQGESRGVRAGGVYIDSVGAGRVGLWGSENYRRAHWRVTGQPLAFNPVSRRPCQVYALSAYDFLRPLAADLRQRGGLLFCNLGGVRALTFLGPVFDLIGREGDCEFPGVSYLGGFDDLDRMYACLHVLSGSRPVSFYDYDWWQPGFDPGGRERRLRLCLFHGVFPGLPWDEAGAVTAAEGLRPVLRRYLPAIERVAQAGWEPVTGAAADGAGVCVERYGDGRRGNLHFTLRNPTALPCRTRLVLDAGEVGIAPEPPALVALDVLRLEPLPLTASRSGYAVDLSLPAEGTTAVALGSPETVARPLVRAAAERLGLITDVAAFAPAHERQPSLDLRPGWYPDRVHNEGGSQVMEDDTLLDLRGRPALRLATGPGNARCVCFAGPWDLRFEQGRPYELLLRCQPPPKRMADGIQPLLSVRLGFEEYFGRGLDDRLCEFPLAAGSAGQWQRVAFTMPDGAYRAFVSFVLAGEKAEAWLLDLRLAPADAADSVLAGLQGATPAEDAWLARELTPGLTRARAQLREAASRPAVPVIEAVQGQLTQLADELRRRWPPGPDLRQTEAWQRLEDARTGLRAALAILGRAGP